MKMTHLAAAAALTLSFALSACGPEADKTDNDTASAGSEPAEKDEAKGAIVESGFGQQREYAYAVALVHNDSDRGGQTVTVSFNLKDAAGSIIASGSQVSAFNWGGQDVPVGTQIEVPKGQKAASVETTLLVEDEGTFDDNTSEDWGTFEGELVKKYGEWGARFLVKNPTDQPLDSAALQVICHAGGKVVGGTSEYPELIAADGEIMVETLSLLVADKPDSCTGYLTPWL